MGQVPWDRFADSTRRVALEVLLHGPLARGELARRTGLSSASLSRLTKPLLDDGVLLEVDDSAIPPSVGRPVQPLDIDTAREHFIGIKLTGSHAFAALTDLRTNTVATADGEVASHRPEDVAIALAELVGKLAPRAGLRAVSICLGGAVEERRVVRTAPFLNWRDVDLAALTAARLDVPVYVGNDLESLLEAERWFGAGRECRNFAVLTTGAGVGAGLVINDTVVTSPDAGLGLLGHQLIDSMGPACPNGHRGCANSFLSVDAICSHLSLALGRHVSYAQGLQLAAAGDPIADQIVGAAARAYGLLIAMVSNIALPERVLLTGEGWELAAVASHRLDQGLREGRNPLAGPVDVQLVPDDPMMWARGAAAVAIQCTVLAGSPG